MNKKINSIDLLKAIAILLVVIFHFSYQATQENSLRIIGSIGVSIFFIASGLALANRYSNLEKFSFKWFFKRYMKIAPIYYLAILGIILLFSTQSYSENILYNLISHFFFLNPYSKTPFTFISPAWFLTPLITFYLLFPFLNLLIKKYKFTLPLFFIIATIIRYTHPTFTSPNPLFYIGEFCFGIALFYNKKDLLLFSPLILFITTIHSLMILPFLMVYFFYIIETKIPSLKPVKFISKYTLAIFLFHESFMNIIYNKWQIYSLNKFLALIILTISMFLIIFLSNKIQNILKQSR